MIDLLRRYFVGNTARVFSVRYHPSLPSRGRFVRCRCGNADGFFWRRWQVMWRVPYAKVWHWNPIAKRWETGRPAMQSPQGHAAAPQAPEAQPRNSAEDEAAEAASQRKGNPDTETRVLIATILLIVILAYAIGGHGIWTGQPLGVTR